MVLFRIFAQKIDRGYTLEPLQCTHDYCFRATCKHQFYYIKVGCKGVCITRTCYHDVIHHTIKTHTQTPSDPIFIYLNSVLLGVNIDFLHLLLDISAKIRQTSSFLSYNCQLYNLQYIAYWPVNVLQLTQWEPFSNESPSLHSHLQVDTMKCVEWPSNSNIPLIGKDGDDVINNIMLDFKS